MTTDVKESVDSDDSPPDFGAWVRSMRLAIEFNQRDLAAKAGISQSYLSDIEVGRVGAPSLAVLNRLAEALGVSKTDVLSVAGIFGKDAPKETAADDSRVLMVIRNLSPEGKATVERFARFVLADERRWIQQSLVEEVETTTEETGSHRPTLFD